MEKLIGTGATAEIYLAGNVAKKIYTNAAISEVESEKKRQQFAYSAGLLVPQVYEIKKLDDGRIVLEMEYIKGVPLMNLKMSEAELIEAMHILVKLQHEIYQIPAPELLNLKNEMTEKIFSTTLDSKVKNELSALLLQLDDKTQQLCHGDFHPLNVLFDGEKHWIIDWVDATCGNPYADICRTYVLLKSQMTELAELYLQVVCKSQTCQPEEILKWLPLVAASRLSENIELVERDSLEQVVMTWYEGCTKKEILKNEEI